MTSIKLLELEGDAYVYKTTTSFTFFNSAQSIDTKWWLNE